MKNKELSKSGNLPGRESNETQNLRFRGKETQTKNKIHSEAEDGIENPEELFGFNQIPEWLRASQFITHGYRQGNQGCCCVTGSLFSWHNETINI
jgi:hypothetical protein